MAATVQFQLRAVVSGLTQVTNLAGALRGVGVSVSGSTAPLNAIVVSSRAVAGAMGGAQTASQKLKNEVMALRNEFQAGVKSEAEFVAENKRLQTGALAAAQGLDRQSKEFRGLTQVAATAQRGIDGATGGVTRLGLASQVHAGILKTGIVGNLTAMVPGAQGATQALGGLTAGGITPMGVAAGVAATAVLGIGIAVGKTIGMAADFEQQMDAVSASMGGNAEQTKKLSALALQLGKDTTFSASEAGKGIENLVRNGVSYKQVLEGAAAATLSLAAANAGTLADSADILTDAYGNFNKEGLTYKEVTNGITAVTVASKFTLNDYALALGQAGGKASSVGLEFADFNAILVATSSKFKSGSDAGTSMGTFLARLIPQSKEAAITMADLGLVSTDLKGSWDANAAALTTLGARFNAGEISGKEYKSSLKALKEEQKGLIAEVREGDNAFFDSAGKLKTASEIAELLKNKLGGLTEQQRLASVQTLFGNDAYRTAVGLYEKGAEGINKLNAEMAKTDAAKQAAERLNNLKGAQEAFKGSLETLGIVIGTVFLPAATKITQWATGAVNGVLEFVTALQKGGDGAKNMAEQFPVIGAVVDALRPVLNGLGELFSGAFTALKTTFETVVKPVLVALKPAFDGAFAGVVTILKTAGEAIGGVLKAIGQILKGDITGALGTIAETIGKTIGGAVKAVAQVGSGIIQTLAKVPGAMLEIGIGIVSNIVTGVRNNLTRVPIIAGEIVGKIIKGVQGLGAEMLSIGKDLIDGIVKGIRANITRLAATVKDIADNVVGGLKQLLGIKSPSRVMAEEVGLPIVQGVAVGITQNMGIPLEAIRSLAANLRDSVEQFAKGDWLQGIGAAVRGLGGLIRDEGAGVNEAINYVVQGIQGVLGSLGKGDWIGAIVAGVSSAVNAIISLFDGAAKSAREARAEFNKISESLLLIDAGIIAKTKTRSRGWFADLFGGPETYLEVNQVALGIAKALESGINGGMKSGIKAFFDGKEGGLLEGLKSGLRDQIISAVTDGFIQSAVLKGALGGLLGQLTMAFTDGTDPSGIIAQIGAALPGIASSLEKVLTPLRDTVNGALGTVADGSGTPAPVAPVTPAVPVLTPRELSNLPQIAANIIANPQFVTVMDNAVTRFDGAISRAEAMYGRVEQMYNRLLDSGIRIDVMTQNGGGSSNLARDLRGGLA